MVRFLGLHHLQLVMPPGREDHARAFYAGVLQLEEIPKPGNLAARGGCWFRAGPVEIHLGVEEAYASGRKAHPALLVDDLAGLEEQLRAAGHEVIEDTQLEGYRRIYASDPFGNRLEFLERLA